jgi:DNA modification methylase
MADEKLEQGQLFDLTDDNRAAIKGFPELRWTGKRPYTSTQYYPAQLKESFGNPSSSGWVNKLFWGDNLQVMSHLLKEFRGKVDLIYIDPPFDSKADYKKTIKLRGQEVQNDSSAFEEKQYGDIWTNDEYLQFMYERLILMRELLSPKGSIYVHMDEKRAAYIKVILDEVFGQNNFRREIIWDVTVLSGFKTQANNWIRGHDVIFYYSKTSDVTFNKLKQAHRKAYLDRFNKTDADGRKYFDGRGVKLYLDDVIKKGKPFGDVWDDTLSYQQLKKELCECSSMQDVYSLIEEVKEDNMVTNVWDDVMSFQQIPTSLENVGYPTQKPESLLERIIEASSNPGDLVFDCFMGSGTTPTVALRLGRRFIGADINLGAVQTTTMRLLKEMDKTDLTNPIEKPGFEVYNVNNYDFFRNPEEAKKIIVDLLELQAFSSGSLFDGEKDGRLYKLMPLNRIATKADLSSLIANLPYSQYDKKMKENPNDPVDRITIVCMGHEPDLLGSFKQETQKYNIDVEIHDVLIEDKDIALKRESEAKIVREGTKLVIKSFYPMNLLQKLNMLPENVQDWKQMVDSIFIDWNYDGKVFRPTLPDVPEDQKLLVRGEYDIPANAKNIRVKITDILSESLEVDVK